MLGLEGVWGLGFRSSGFTGFRGFRVFRVLALGFWGLGFWGLGFRGSGFGAFSKEDAQRNAQALEEGCDFELGVLHHREV